MTHDVTLLVAGLLTSVASFLIGYVAGCLHCYHKGVR